MNKQVGRPLKSLNIRDYSNDPQTRQMMGLFKHSAYELGLTQAELLKRLYYKSIKQVKAEVDFEQGNCMEIDLKELDNE